MLFEQLPSTFQLLHSQKRFPFEAAQNMAFVRRFMGFSLIEGFLANLEFLRRFHKKRSSFSICEFARWAKDYSEDMKHDKCLYFAGLGIFLAAAIFKEEHFFKKVRFHLIFIILWIHTVLIHGQLCYKNQMTYNVLWI